MQQLQRHLAVDEVVVRQQQPGAGVVLAQLAFSVCGVAVGRGVGDHAVPALQAGGEPEGAAHTRRAAGTGLAAHQLRQPPRDGQAQPGAAVFAGGGRVGLLKGLKQARHLRRGNAHAGVLYLKTHQQPLRRVFQQLGPQGNRTLLGELDGVAGKVEQGLAQPRGVAAQPQRHGIGVHRDVQALVACGLPNQRVNVVQNSGQVKVGVLQLQAPGFDFGEVQDVVDDAQQVPAGVVDFVKPQALGGRHARTPYQVVEPDDGVHGRADFVAHVGQKGALGAVGRFGLLPGRTQLGRALRHQVFQVQAVAVQLVAQVFLLGDVFLHRHVVADGAVGLAQRADDGEFDVLRAVFSAVVKLTFPRQALRHGRPHGYVSLRWGVARMQDARVLPNDLFTGVARGRQKGVVDVLDLCLHVGDDDVFSALVQGQRQLA